MRRHLLVLVCVVVVAPQAFAQRGVPQSGFPAWQERMLQVLFNRVRADPTVDPKACTSNTVRPPLVYSYDHNRAARFHSANLSKTGCFQHNSPCLLHSDISMRYPPLGTCDGSASCACTNAVACDPNCTSTTCTQTFSRMTLFGASGSGEIIARGYGSPRSATSGWMNSSGHCSIILGGSSQVGNGWFGSDWTGNFGNGGTLTGTLIAGGHEVGTSFGQFTSTSSQNVGFRVNYYNTAGGPQSAQLNLNGTCTAMTLERGSQTNGTWLVTLPIGDTQCRRYVFTFKDPAGNTVNLPETGSYGIGGSLATCADWDATTPPPCGGSNLPPTIASAAAATPNPVAGTTTQVSVLGADDGGEAALTYTWSATGPAAVAFSPNGTNAAKGATATFAAAGGYTLTATVTDASGLKATSAVTVNVSPTLTTIAVSPPSTSVVVNGTQQFTATGRDQFGAALATQPSFTWTTSGGGTMDATGLFTAQGTTGGPFTVTAASGQVMGTSQVTITAGNPPSLAAAASATPDPVTGTTAQVSVSATDDGGAANLTYQWSATGPAAVTFTPNGTGAAQNATASFSTAGMYELTVRVSDASGQSVSSAVMVSVVQTPTAIAVTPSSISVMAGGTQQFSAAAADQFGQALTPQPAFTWSVSGGGTISAAGLFTAAAQPGGPFIVTAASGSISGTAAVTVGAAPVDTTPPTVAVSSPVAGAILAGTVTLGASASDNVGVARVELLVDGAVVGTTSAPPFELSWDSRSVANGGHAITARAFDYAGSEAVSAPVAVTVANSDGTGADIAPPQVAIAQPSSDGAEVSSTLLVRASASDDVGVVEVRFELDGVRAATAAAEPWEATLDLADAAYGDHTLVAVAKDAAGNEGRSAPVLLRKVGVREVTGKIGCSGAGAALAPLLSLGVLAWLSRRRR